MAVTETHRPSPAATALATLTGNLYLVVGTLVCSTLALVAALVPPRGRWMHYVSRAWARGVLATSFIRLEVERGAPIGGDGRAVYLANHQSLFDIPVLLLAIPGQVRFLAKASLFRIPIFGWALRLGGFVPVDRGDRVHGRASFSRALDRLQSGVSVLIFPEETRSLDGRLLPFRRGGLLLALKTGLPIVPVGIHGTLEVQTRRSFAIRPATVRVRFGAPVELGGESVRGTGRLAGELRARVAELAGTTLAEPGAAEAQPSG